MPFAFGAAPKTGQAEHAMGASAENFSECDSDEVDRLRRFSGLLATSVRRAESDARWKQHAEAPARNPDSDDALLPRAKNESKGPNITLLS